MRRKHLIAFIAWLLLALGLTVGVKVFYQSSAMAQANTNLMVSAAASLKDSLAQVGQSYRQVKSNIAVNYNFGASGALQRQIENGAPADIFISASPKQMDVLQQKNLIIANTRRNLLTNRVVLIVPKNSTVITSFRGLTAANVKRIAIGEPRSVPAGQYAEESGNADAGVIYTTDARGSNRVKVVETAATNLHSPIVYPVAVVSNSKNVAAAREYVQFLASDRRALTIFQRAGFGRAN
jgi:molybdate transport system substrate-binding protein